jgi:hypothetical protein
MDVSAGSLGARTVAGEPPPLLLQQCGMTESVSGMQWVDIPTHLLRAELLRRQEQGRQEQERPACGTKGNRGYYNTPLHVFALILILTVSTAGMLPSKRAAWSC